MKRMNTRDASGRRRRGPLLGALGAAALSTIGLQASADHGLPHAEALGRGTFYDDAVSAKFRVKDTMGATQVLQMQDASDMVVLRITIEAGGIAPWHTHEGSGFLINTGPGTVTNVVGEDCIPTDYPPGNAFVDPGVGDLHAVRNDSDQEVVLIAVFFGIQTAPVIPTGEGPEGCYFLP